MAVTPGSRRVPRPKTERELPFVRQRAVRWFNAGVLGPTRIRMALSSAFARFFDKRELEASVEAHPLRHWADAPELWIDFIADTGDGFDPTYTVAWLASRPHLPLDTVERPLPRADLVVFGGDEVYPVGSADAYQQRFVGPYQAALPKTTAGARRELYAIPGNHDWYDGLTGFVRLFCQGKEVGGRQTCQSRSYFALQLPHRWWLWGVDIQLDSSIDGPQLAFFEEVAAEMAPGDRVVLCTGKPSWVDARSTPQGYRGLADLEDRLITPRRARLMLSLSGD